MTVHVYTHPQKCRCQLPCQKLESCQTLSRASGAPCPELKVERHVLGSGAPHESGAIDMYRGLLDPG
eukprot:m.112670 g.112670  ORF g.112670 m.112670 type:complete len:67 (+) comp10788_c0_seq3:176-376(+)